MDRIHKEASEILKRELNEEWGGHNDLKPENILFKASPNKGPSWVPSRNGETRVLIKIADFGSGGTPGWTWPRFLSKREPGRSDMYSVGLLILYVMCESRDLFYRLRDNYIESNQEWLIKFREEPIIDLVMKMMNLKLAVQEASQKWNEISVVVDFLQRSLLTSPYSHARVPSKNLDVQDKMVNSCAVDTTVLDK